MMWQWQYVYMVVLILGWSKGAKGKEAREIRTPQGAVRGYKDPDTNVFIFHSIPYATAPKGKLKFQAPLPPPAWITTFDAMDKGIICPQHEFDGSFTAVKNMQEDCLVANVYVPDTNKKNLPVVVYIHGGGFQIGYGDMLTPKEFVRDKNVIAVTFNYRLGIHGFLCLGTENAPGNAGIKDQVALLRWVKRNIASYGGNPDDVTISGYSAGSTSVDLILLSNSARGLFHKAILESGSNIGVFAVQKDPLEIAKTHARTLNFDKVDDVYALEEFYLTAPYELLTSYDFINIKNSTFMFVPCVERFMGKERFLSDTPLNILKSKKFTKVPMLYGFANMEGLMRMNLFEVWKDQMNEKFSDFLPADLQFENEDQKELIAKSIKEFYFGNKPVNDDTMLSYIDYFSDIFFTYSTLKSAKLQLNAGNDNIYLYEYNFVDVGGTPTGYKNMTVNGAQHCAQTGTVMDWSPFLGNHKDSLSEDFKKMQNVLREMWSNFISTGKPVPEGSSLPAWPPMKDDWSPYMSLGNKVELKGSLLKERALFWESIYERYYRSPIPPPMPPPIHSEL